MFKLCINNNRYKNLSVGLDIYFVLDAWFYFTVEHQCRYLNSFFIVFDIFLWIIETEVSDDQRKKSEKSTKESQVKYIVNGIVGAVCFIIIVATISCCVVKMKKQSSTIHDEVQAYCSSLATNEGLLENLNTEQIYTHKTRQIIMFVLNYETNFVLKLFVLFVCHYTLAYT